MLNDKAYEPGGTACVTKRVLRNEKLKGIWTIIIMKRSKEMDNVQNF